MMVVTQHANDGNHNKSNWFSLSQNVWQSDPPAFAPTSIGAALTPAKLVLTSCHFYWIRQYLVDISTWEHQKRKCHLASLHGRTRMSAGNSTAIVQIISPNYLEEAASCWRYCSPESKESDQTKVVDHSLAVCWHLKFASNIINHGYLVLFWLFSCSQTDFFQAKSGLLCH